LAAGIAFFLAIVAFRRVRGVVAPPSGRSLARPRPVAGEGRFVHYVRASTALVIGVRVVLGLAAVVGIAALARHLFDR
jgi:hypothetical protein